MNKDKKLHKAMTGILKDFHQGLKRNIERKRKELQKILREYVHDCHASTEDGCQTCEWIDSASLEELLTKVKEFELEKEEARADHLAGDYEHPTPSNTKDAINNFGVDPDVNGRDAQGKIL